MNRRMIALALVCVMVLCAGCRRDDPDPTQTTADQTAATTEATEPLTTVPGTAQNVFGSDAFDEEPDETETTPGGEQNGEEDDTPGGSSDGEKTTQPTQPENTDPEPTDSAPTDPKPTDPVTTEPQPTDPENTDPETNDPSSDANEVTYEEYNNMSPEEQMAYYSQFPSMEAFVEWYNRAKAAYDEEHGAIDVGDGNIDLGDLINP